MKFLIFSALLAGFVSNSWGAGYQVRYQGAESMGTAFASSGSYGASLSSIYYNPALFLSQDKENAMSLELMAAHPLKAEFTPTGGGTVEDDFVDTSFSGSYYYGHRIDHDTAFTVALTTPWGIDTEYGASWAGASAAVKTKLQSLNLQPMISKRIGEKLVFSIGPQIQYLKGTLSSSPAPTLVSELDGKNISVGGVLALTYTPSERTTLSFNYTSQIKHNLRGEITADAPIPSFSNAALAITTPDVFTLGFSHSVSERLIGHFSASYTNWSLLKGLPISTSGTVISTVPGSWDDTYMVALGATFNASETMTFRGGLSYETSAVENSERTPRSQDSDRVGLGLGASMPIGGMTLDIGFNQIFYIGDIELEAPYPTGSYDMSFSLLRAGLEYKF